MQPQQEQQPQKDLEEHLIQSIIAVSRTYYYHEKISRFLCTCVQKEKPSRKRRKERNELYKKIYINIYTYTY